MDCRLQKLEEGELSWEYLNHFGGEFDLTPSQDAIAPYVEEYKRRGILPPYERFEIVIIQLSEGSYEQKTQQMIFCFGEK